MSYTAMVVAAVVVQADGIPVTVKAGSVMRLDSGSAMETALGGSGNLLTITNDQNVPPDAAAVSN